MSHLANTYELPYYAVIFASERTEGDQGYHVMAAKMAQLASKQKGYLGVESARDAHLGITVPTGKRLKILQPGRQMPLIRWHKSVEKRNGIVDSHYVYAKWSAITYLKCK